MAKVTDDIKKLFEIVCRLTLEEWDTAKCLINEAFQDEMYIAILCVLFLPVPSI